MSLDSVALSDSSNKPISQTQDKHIAQFNSLNKIMASLADYYQAGKSNDTNLISSLRDDFNSSWIIGSDKIIYNSDNLEGTIISYYGSTVITPFERKILIPDYSNGELLGNVLNNVQGLAYLQTLFNTIDTAEEIKNTLNNLSGKDITNTKVWTPNQGSRKSTPNRVAFLDSNGGLFRINGYNLNSSGRSRGVLESPVGTALDNKYAIPNIAVDIYPNLKQGINKKSECVFLSNIQEIDNISKYAGIFFFHNNRFVYSMTSQKIEDETPDKTISSILALPKTTKEKLETLEETFNPIYAHLQKYEKNDTGFLLVDDAESFMEPKILVKP
jgi:hypothetical protein